MKKPNKLYFLVTADEFELPVYIETSWRKLSEVSHISVPTLVRSASRGILIKKRYRVEIINLPETLKF